MPKIIFEVWEVGMRPISFIKLLHAKAGLTLKESQDIRMKVMDEIVEITVSNDKIAEEIVEKSIKLGVKARLSK